MLPAKLFDQLADVAAGAQLQSSYQAPQPVSFLFPDQDNILCSKCFGLSMGRPALFSRQSKKKKRIVKNKARKFSK